MGKHTNCDRPDYNRRHRELMLPVVRVRTEKALGSGTVIYSQGNGEKGYSTFVLTNEHVVDNLIAIEKRWSNLLQREVKKDVLGIPECEFFEYAWEQRAVGARAVQADIMAYDKEEDLALLKLRSTSPVASVAKLFPQHEENTLRATMPVFAVGAGLGETPVITEGMLSSFGQIIDRREFWMNTGPAIYGNSGGALFLAETHELIGVPSRLAVTWSQAIPHLQYAIPITRIYGFLADQRFRFIYDPNFTEAGEAKERERIRREQELRAKAEEEKGEGEETAKVEDSYGQMPLC